VPDIDGATHRYMLSAPGCWALYGRLQAGGYPMSQFSVDGYAVQHPGNPGPQASQSVCGHLMNLCRVLERHGNPADGPVFLASITHRAYPWLAPPPPQYPITVVELVGVVDRERFKVIEREYAEGVWQVWRDHHAMIRRLVDDANALPSRTRS